MSFPFSSLFDAPQLPSPGSDRFRGGELFEST
jgi:hypothetical protein